MTTETSSALAVREFSDSQLQQRMKANINARFGLHEASPAQLNIVFLLAKRWGLDPVNEITLYEGRPFITLDGRLQLMRRHPAYRGFKTRPLSRQEREDWGYEPDDVVVEACIRTADHGEISERGCVRRAEIDGARGRAKESGKRAAPVGIYGPEIAEKRAIARASRAAFGQDVPDEEDAQIVIEEQQNPERMKALAAQYTDIHGAEDDWGIVAEQPVSIGSAPPAEQLTRETDTPSSVSRGPAEEGAMVTSKRHPLWAAWTAAVAQAEAEGVETYNLALPCHDDVLKASTTSLLEMIENKREAVA
jgi:hypothetical protein